MKETEFQLLLVSGDLISLFDIPAKQILKFPPNFFLKIKSFSLNFASVLLFLFIILCQLIYELKVTCHFFFAQGSSQPLAGSKMLFRVKGELSLLSLLNFEQSNTSKEYSFLPAGAQWYLLPQQTRKVRIPLVYYITKLLHRTT